MQILHKLGALRKKKTPATIDDVEFNFYPVRVARVLTGDLKDIIEPVSDAIQVLLQPRNADQEVLEEIAPDGTVARGVKPMSAEMARYRAEKRKETMKAAMEAVFADATRYKLTRLIMDSLRDDCPADPSDEDVKAFADHETMDVVRFSAFFKGFLAANTAIFGDLGKLIRERIAAAMEKMNTPSDQDQEDAPEQPQAETSEATRALQEEGEVPTT